MTARPEQESETPRVDDLRAFVRAVFDAIDWPRGGDLDSEDFQRIATQHGLLTPETRTEPCGEVCHCAEYCGTEEMAEGVTCYRKAAWLLDAPAAELSALTARERDALDAKRYRWLRNQHEDRTHAVFAWQRGGELEWCRHGEQLDELIDRALTSSTGGS